MTDRNRRAWTRHKGVKIRKREWPVGHPKWPSGGTRYFAVWRDVATGKQREVSLTHLTTAEQRRDWCVRKARELDRERKAQERAALDAKAGGVPVELLSVEAGVERYLGQRAAVLRPRTIELYREGIVKFQDWAAGAGVIHCQELSSAGLSSFYSHMLTSRRLVSARGGGRGDKITAREGRSPGGINIDLGSVKTMLLEWTRWEVLPLLTRDKIVDILRPAPVSRDRPNFLRPEEVRSLLGAALRHDRECFAMTRAEVSGQRGVGSTRRYKPIAPFVLYVLLTGCRVGEAMKLRRQDVLAEEREIVVPATGTKTRQSREVDLTVSPALSRLVSVLCLRTGGDPYLFGSTSPMPRHEAENARRRLTGTFGAPTFGWHDLRRTCATVLVNSNVFEVATVWRAARQLGHAASVCESRYAGLMKGVDADARSVESVLGIKALADEIIDEITGQPAVHQIRGEPTNGEGHERPVRRAEGA